ncbi:MAG: acyl-CoA dehydrogenase, partial [Gordonia polyisoprenivorans]|nr:acyl-CoA dehydrogenase [Gordonia polyisoprenivorans]
IHGGIGITWEHDIQLYFKRAQSSSQLFGQPHEVVADMVERLRG